MTVLDDIEVPAWMSEGACVDHDPEMFFPEQGGTTKPAKAICDLCSVKAECLEYALTWKIKFGIWGGTSQKDRTRIRQGLEFFAKEAA